MVSLSGERKMNNFSIESVLNALNAPAVNPELLLDLDYNPAPMSLNAMMSNIENNGAPWQYNQQDRLNWKNE
jgi:hypothetical protein